MGEGKVRNARKNGVRCLATALSVLMGSILFGQGCADVDKLVQESQQEYEFARQMKWAENELQRGNLLSARTVFEWVRRESKRPSLQQRAQFFSSFTTILDEKDKNRWDRGRQMFLRGSEEFPEGEIGQISGHIAVALQDLIATVEHLQNENESMRLEFGSVQSKSREMSRLVQKQEKELSEKTEEIAALKNSIRLRNQEIEGLEMKLKKLEEIYKEIKEKRKGLS
jgi:chromosome segregation ATPase